jgi:DNA-binding NarL/FixJ family response regulator
MIRILLADDHAVVRRGFRRILSSEPDYEVCAEAANGEEAVSLAALLRPDVVILDIVMPGVNGIEAARKIPAVLPECEVAIVTMHESDELMRAAIAAGALAYLLKSDVDQHLIPAIRSLADHRPYPSR